MRINKWLWGLWVAMIISMLLRRQADTYMIVALIIIPILIVLLDLHEEIAILIEENKHQRKFVMDRYNILSERMNDVNNQVEKRLVVDFAEFAQSSSQAPAGESTRMPPESSKSRKRRLKKRRQEEQPKSVTPLPDFNEMTEKPEGEAPPPEDPSQS